jgi:hypothetical protein
VFYSSLFRDGEAKAGFPPDWPGQVEKAIKVPTEVSGWPEVQTGKACKGAGFLKRATTKDGILIAFSLSFFSALA